MISSVDLAHYRVSCAKDWVSVDCGTSSTYVTGQYMLHLLIVAQFIYRNGEIRKYIAR